MTTESDRDQLARRKFLAKCGKFAFVTPAAVTLLLAASEQNFATAASGGSSGGSSGGGIPGAPPGWCGIITPECPRKD